MVVLTRARAMQTAIGRRDSSESKTGAVSGAAKPQTIAEADEADRQVSLFKKKTLKTVESLILI